MMLDGLDITTDLFQSLVKMSDDVFKDKQTLKMRDDLACKMFSIEALKMIGMNRDDRRVQRLLVYVILHLPLSSVFTCMSIELRVKLLALCFKYVMEIQEHLIAFPGLTKDGKRLTVDNHKNTNSLTLWDKFFVKEYAVYLACVMCKIS